jgi:hypothetical protein
MTISGPANECGEESVEHLDVHRPAALAAFEEVAEAVKLGVGQRLVLGEGLQLFFRVVFGFATEPT